MLFVSLGKTLQALVAVAIAHHESKRRCQSLVVCPSTLVRHWSAEVDKLFPNGSVFRVLCLDGNQEERRKAWKVKAVRSDLVIVSYAVLRADIELLCPRHWYYCILDEGHLLKNPKTGR